MSDVKIEELQLVPVKFKKGLTFFASCVLDGRYFVGDIAIYSLKDGSGFRCVYPTKILKNSQKIPIFHPVNKKVNDQIQEEISKRARELLVGTLEEGIRQTGGEQ